jgi:hypothetical protein
MANREVLSRIDQDVRDGTEPDWTTTFRANDLDGRRPECKELDLDGERTPSDMTKLYVFGLRREELKELELSLEDPDIRLHDRPDNSNKFVLVKGE